MKSYTIKKFKVVSDQKHLLAEGPLWDHKFSRYLFVDIKKNYFYIFKNNILKKYKIKKKITSIILTNKENVLIFTTFDSIIQFDLTKKKMLKLFIEQILLEKDLMIAIY